MRRRRSTQPSPAAVRAARAKRQRAREELRRGRRSFAYAAVFTVLAISVYGVSSWLLGLTAGSQPQLTGAVHSATRWGSAAAFVVFGVLGSRAFASALAHLVAARSASSAGAAVRLVGSATGYTIVFFGLLQIVGIPVAHLLLGAGLAGIVLGIAGQQTLGNVFAGMVLVTARPFSVGDHVRIRSGALGGIFEGDVIAMTLTYVTLTVDGIPMKVPNSGMLAAAVGRLPRRSGQTGPVPVVNGGAPARPVASGPVPVADGSAPAFVTAAGEEPAVPSGAVPAASAGARPLGPPAPAPPVQDPRAAPAETPAAPAEGGDGGVGGGGAGRSTSGASAGRAATRRRR